MSARNESTNSPTIGKIMPVSIFLACRHNALRGYIDDMSVKPIRHPSRIKQAELEAYIGLANEKRRALRRVCRIARELISRMDAGARVEPGTHTAELIRSFRGAKMVVTLEVR